MTTYLKGDPGFFKGGRMWLVPCAVESKGHAPKCCNLRTGT